MDEDNGGRADDYADWKKRSEAGGEDPRELFQQVCHIAVCMSYDLVDKLRWWEKETLKLPDAEVERRIPHMSSFLERLQEAYLQFADTDI